MTTPVVPVTPRPDLGRRWYDRTVPRAAYRTGAWIVSPITGDDGRPSWWKLMGAGVLLTYWRGVALPVPVAVVLIFCAFGVKVALAMIQAYAAAKGAVLPGAVQDAPPAAPAAPPSAQGPAADAAHPQPPMVPADGTEEG